MAEETDRKEAIQWHPAFYAGIQIELIDEEESLLFENEHQLGTKPMEIDVLIIKKNQTRKIKKNIGQIFRAHNIVEYKGPKDYLSVNDFYKVYGYACFYKADTPREGQIKASEITISFVCKRYPQKLIEHLRKAYHFNIVKKDKGIYYVYGDKFPIQIIVTSKLSEENNFWLKNLTDDIKDPNVASEITTEYQRNRHDKRYQSVMDIIVRANKKSFGEVQGMCEALKELFQDEFDRIARELAEEKAKELAEEKAKELAEEKAKELAEEKAKELAKEMAEREKKSIRSLMKNMKLSLEQAMDALDIPQENRLQYSGVKVERL